MPAWTLHGLTCSLAGGPSSLAGAGAQPLRLCDRRQTLSARSGQERRHSRGVSVRAQAQQQQQQQRGGPAEEHVDTRIHWKDPNEGWIEGDISRSTRAAVAAAPADASGQGIWPIGRDLVMAIMDVESSHYTTLGVTPTANMESVKVAYRRLSKLYHPDTTDLPLGLAEQKFVQLREAYSVLSSPEQRRLYDWRIASTASKKRGARFVWPYEVDQSQKGPGSRTPQPLEQKRRATESNVDENGNVPLSDSSLAALSFDLFALVVAVATIVYASYFKS